MQPAKPPTHRRSLSHRSLLTPFTACSKGSGGAHAAAAAAPMDAAPAFQLDRVSLAANFVARADPRNGKAAQIFSAIKFQVFRHRL
ncbi:MAG: hypothetical protein GC192_23000 [Bacteroidetes bacterium]|nr:hypothetical protein [Bacteroidota bacterium]